MNKSLCYKLLALSLLLMFFSCKKELKIDASIISSFINCKHEDKCYVLIVPMDGCSGCRSLAIKYINDSTAMKPSFHYIASTHNTKLAKIRLGYAASKINIKIDSNELFFNKGVIGKYPVLYQLENGNVLDKKVLDASIIQEELYTL